MKLLDLLRKVTGYRNLVLYDNRQKLEEWSQWYRGNLDGFHDYTIYNGKNPIRVRRLSLNMAKKVCEDWANLLINEKTDITLSDERSQEVFEEIARATKFWLKANVGVEKTMALGGGAWVVSVDNLSAYDNGTVGDDGKPEIAFVSAKNMIPITIEDDRITECAFVKFGTSETRIAVHLRNKNGEYEVHNFVSEGVNLEALIIDDSKSYVFKTGSREPWYVVLKPNIANNIKLESPLGISVFANATDCLRQIDLVFDSYANEFLLGKKRIFVNVQNSDIDPITGEQHKVFDDTDLTWYRLPEAMDGKQLIQDNTQLLRVSEHQQALQNHLNLLSYNCGMGTEHYKFDKGSISTATQIISENSEMFRSIKKQEILVEDALIELVRILIYVCNTFTPYKMNPDVDIEVKFDDSIIIDKESERAQDRLDVAMGTMSKAEYRSKWYNEDLETAERIIDEIDSESIFDGDITTTTGEEVVTK